MKVIGERSSKYWDDFQRRIHETVKAIQQERVPPIRRVSVFITNKCNFYCKYCNHQRNKDTLSESGFREVLDKYGDTAIIHITGGEPSVVPWLYPFLKKYRDKYKFHLNTNAYILPPFKSIRRLKISLDSHDKAYWDSIVGRSGAFSTVVANIKKAIPHTVTSITYTLTKENYKGAINFARFAGQEFVGLYALFFSVYKGTNPIYRMTDEDSEYFFYTILPQLKRELPEESLALLQETIDEKRRIMSGIRFPENEKSNTCYLSMSEKVISPTGKEFTCSHLYRDGIYQTVAKKHDKCFYGCNRRLVKFNEQIEKELTLVLPHTFPYRLPFHHFLSLSRQSKEIGNRLNCFNLNISNSNSLIL